MAPHAHEAMSRDSHLPSLVETPDSPSTQRPQASSAEFDEMEGLQVPTHPMPSMQGPFAESMIEASVRPAPPSPKPDKADAVVRRQILLDQDATEATHASKWRQKPGQKYHQLWKLIAQISFGSYLLFEGIAKDDDQVLNILQGHVDEVDEFLESTLDDFDHAEDDIEERLKCLKIPLENIAVFDGMLEDRQFRSQIVKGNERIEHVISRTTTAMNDALRDVQQGVSATKEFAIWLAKIQEHQEWTDRPDMEKVYDAMKGNADGWYKAYVSLQAKGNQLNSSLAQLDSVVTEMDRRATDVSQRSRSGVEPGKSPRSPTQRGESQILGEEPRVDAENLAVITLQPRTYSPAPQLPSSRSPVRSRDSFHESDSESSAPELNRTPSHRQHFSLRRKNNPPFIVLPPTNDFQPVARDLPSQRLSPMSYQRPSSSAQSARGPDSAHYSDFDSGRLSRSSNQYQDSYFNPPHTSFHSGSNQVTSPRSDQLHFRPVNASPHSPLQRPWTAAPNNTHSYLRPPSTTNLSVADSQMTTVTENGKKVKKKRSGFGWLKKAFSLSEEEKAAFEEKRRAELPPVNYYRQERPIFLDGKRIR